MSNLIMIIGGGPAGLMAAQQLVGRGLDVHLYDAMPSLGRKFLMAGKSGLNLTHSDSYDIFCQRYHDDAGRLQRSLAAFTPDDVRAWAHDLGTETFVGSSGRVFPTTFKAAPLLRAWLRRLRAGGLTIHVRHRWVGWSGEDALFETPQGLKKVRAQATVLAVGSACWPRLGSDGAWQSVVQDQGVSITPFAPSNVGVQVSWSDAFAAKWAGHPLKPVRVGCGDQRVRGECVVSQTGLEGSAIYTISRGVRLQGQQDGFAHVVFDLAPDRSLAAVKAALQTSRGRKSVSDHLKKTVGLSPVKVALLREIVDKDTFMTPDHLAAVIKALPIPLSGLAALEEAISCAGGVDFEAMQEDLSLKARPSVFCAGEMLNWDAPTGGYLLTACFALGKTAGQGVLAYLRQRSDHPA